MKKIWILTYSAGLGGSELNAYKITQILKQHSFDWSCLSFSKVDLLPLINSTSNIHKVSNLNYSNLLSIAFLKQINQVIKTENYSTVYAIGFMPAVIISLVKILFRPRVRFISTRREVMPWLRFRHIPFIGLINLLSTRVETNSKKILSSLKKQFILNKKAYLLPNITLKPNTDQKLDFFKDEFIYVGLVANVRKAKNIELFLNIAKKMIINNKKLIFVIAGQDSQNLVKNFINKYALDGRLVIFEDISFENINKFYSGLDIFLFTSIHEGSPNVIFEALSYGLPIVASDIPATSEVIDKNINGFLVNVNKIDKFILKINLLLQNRNLKEAIQRNNLKKSNLLNNIDNTKRILSKEFL